MMWDDLGDFGGWDGAVDWGDWFTQPEWGDGAGFNPGEWGVGEGLNLDDVYAPGTVGLPDGWSNVDWAKLIGVGSSIGGGLANGGGGAGGGSGNSLADIAKLLLPLLAAGGGAAMTRSATDKATEQMQRAVTEANTKLEGLTATGNAAYAPYRQAGTDALAKLNTAPLSTIGQRYRRG